MISRRALNLLIISVCLSALALGQTTKIGGTGKLVGPSRVQTSGTTGGGGGFPTNLTLLDDFNRADEGPPPNVNWTTGWRPSTGGFSVDSNRAYGATGGDNSTYWNTTFGPDVEVFAKMVDGSSASYQGISARLVNVGTSGVNGYEIVMFSNQIYVRRWDSNAEFPLGVPIDQTYTAGDSMGMTIIGSTISIYYKVGAGAWNLLDTRTDATYSAAGKIGLRSENIHWDDFGGGSL